MFWIIFGTVGFLLTVVGWSCMAAASDADDELGYW